MNASEVRTMSITKVEVSGRLALACGERLTLADRA
jgi:hypothetical protein